MAILGYVLTRIDLVLIRVNTWLSLSNLLLKIIPTYAHFLHKSSLGLPYHRIFVLIFHPETLRRRSEDAGEKSMNILTSVYGN